MIFAISRAIVAFLLSLLVTRILTVYVLPAIAGRGGSGAGGPLSPALQFMIRFFETGLVFIFVIEREYTALAVLLAADLLVRRKWIAEDPHSHFLGTVCTFAVATIFAVVARAWMSKFLAILIV